MNEDSTPFGSGSRSRKMPEVALPSGPSHAIPGSPPSRGSHPLLLEESTLMVRPAEIQGAVARELDDSRKQSARVSLEASVKALGESAAHVAPGGPDDLVRLLSVVSMALDLGRGGPAQPELEQLEQMLDSFTRASGSMNEREIADRYEEAKKRLIRAYSKMELTP